MNYEDLAEAKAFDHRRHLPEAPGGKIMPQKCQMGREGGSRVSIPASAKGSSCEILPTHIVTDAVLCGEILQYSSLKSFQQVKMPSILS